MMGRIVGITFYLCEHVVYWAGLFFSLELYAMRGGFLHQALCAGLIYACATGLLRLHGKRI